MGLPAAQPPVVAPVVFSATSPALFQESQPELAGGELSGLLFGFGLDAPTFGFGLDAPTFVPYPGETGPGCTQNNWTRTAEQTFVNQKCLTNFSCLFYFGAV